MKGKLFRIAHIGYYDYLDTIGVLAALEHVLAQVTGKPVEFGDRRPGGTTRFCPADRNRWHDSLSPPESHWRVPVRDFRRTERRASGPLQSATSLISNCWSVYANAENDDHVRRAFSSVRPLPRGL